MTELEHQASELVTKAKNASHEERLRLQPKIDSVISEMILQGHTVPVRLRHFNDTLKDEAIDDMFDNMPV